MDKRERGLTVFAVAFFAAVALVVDFGQTWLNQQLWFGTASNVIQLISGPATLGAVISFVWMRWTGRCATPRCIRHGAHPVNGTLRKVCDHHHTRVFHELCHDIHGEAHAESGRLGFGESHDRATR